MYSVLYLPVDPPCSSGFGEEQVTVRQLLEPLSPHCHVKLTTLQLIAISHWGAFIGVEAREHTIKRVIAAITHQHGQTRTIKLPYCILLQRLFLRGTYCFPLSATSLKPQVLYCEISFRAVNISDPLGHRQEGGVSSQGAK